MRSNRVLVVGGSASGFFTAYLLARAGADVTVVERSSTFAPVARTLIATASLHAHVGPLADEAVVNEVHRFDLYADGHCATVELGRPDVVVERSAVIASMAREAERAGARLLRGRDFRTVEPARDSLRVSIADRDGSRDEIEVGTIVGADGVSSRVAVATGWPLQPTVPLLQAIVRLPEDLRPGTSRVWFRPQDTPYFYWLVPHADGHGALGAIGHDPASIRYRLDRFLEGKGFEPLDYQAARVPRYGGWVPVHRRVGRGDVYLVGDAAAQVKISTVGGLVTGFRGARGVVDAILGRRSSHLRALRRELDAHLLVRRILHGFSEADYVALLSLLNDPTRAVLTELTRDQAPKMLVRIARSQPRLLLVGARALARARPEFPEVIGPHSP